MKVIVTKDGWLPKGTIATIEGYVAVTLTVHAIVKTLEGELTHLPLNNLKITNNHLVHYNHKRKE